MPTSVTMRIKLDEAQIVAELDGAATQSQVDDVAEAVLAMQHTIVPVDTGDLDRSLEIRPTENGRGRLVGSFGIDYAEHVEFGHETTAGTWVAAQPFIRPSVDAARAVMARGK